MKEFLKKQAVELRKLGWSYSEIKSKIKVSKSTLSLWLRSEKITDNQAERLAGRRQEAALITAKNRKNERIVRENMIIAKAMEEIGPISKKSLLLIGIALYWAEGSKKIKGRTGGRVIFANSDPKMVKVYLRWLDSIGIKLEDVWFELYIHQDCLGQKPDFVKYWSECLEIEENMINRVYIKKNVSRKRSDNYHGLIRIGVRKSTDFYRKISGWIEGIYQNIAGSSNGRTPLFGSGYSRFES